MNNKKLSLLLIISLLSALLVTPVFAGETVEPDTEPAVLASTDNEGADYICDLASANDAGLVYSLDETNKEMSIIGYTGNATSLTISENYGGYKVTKIGERAFWGLTEDEEHYNSNTYMLQELILPDTVEEIGKLAFAHCTSLKSLYISARLKNTEFNGCIYECKSLKKIFIPKSIVRFAQDFLEGGSAITDIYYAGSLEDYRNIAHDPSNDLNSFSLDYLPFSASIHLNSTKDDFLNNRNAGSCDNLNASFHPVTVSPDSTVSISYNSIIAFYGKKPLLENFGEIKVTVEGKEYTASKVKINKKNKKIQITKLSGADKAATKKVKKLTKGSKGLDFSVVPYYARFDSDVKYKLSGGKMTGLSIKINGKYYKMKKNKFGYYTNNIDNNPVHIARFMDKQTVFGFYRMND